MAPGNRAPGTPWVSGRLRTSRTVRGVTWGGAHCHRVRDGLLGTTWVFVRTLTHAAKYGLTDAELTRAAYERARSPFDG